MRGGSLSAGNTHYLPSLGYTRRVATYISTQDGLRAVAQHLLTRPRVSLDLETTGLDPLKDEILLVGLDEYAILGRLDLSPLKPLIESNDLPKVIFNAAFDGMFLQRRGMLPYRVFDPMIGAILLKSGLSTPAAPSRWSICSRRA